MICTEEKAKEKFCCQDVTDKCKGSECMGWRWYDSLLKHCVECCELLDECISCKNNRTYRNIKESKQIVNEECSVSIHHHNLCPVFKDQEMKEKRTGYCGIAGDIINFD